MNRKAVRTSRWKPEWRVNYNPLDETLEKTDVRILRALRHFDSIEASDLWELLNVPRGREPGDDGERSKFYSSMSRLAREGLVARSGLLGERYYRITPAGRAELARRLTVDMAIEFAPFPEERNRAA